MVCDSSGQLPRQCSSWNSQRALGNLGHKGEPVATPSICL